MNSIAKENFLELLSESLHENILAQFKRNLVTGTVLELDNFDFKSWTDEHAMFRVSSEYNNHEFCISFIKTALPMPKIKTVKKGNMLSVEAKEIHSEVPVTFKGYIYLERNNRFFLYIKNGRHLLPEQKKRLENHNIKTICVKDIDEKNLKSFLLSILLKESMSKKKAS